MAFSISITIGKIPTNGLQQWQVYIATGYTQIPSQPTVDGWPRPLWLWWTEWTLSNNRPAMIAAP